MKQITLHVYQSIDGCPVSSDKYFDAAVDASGFVLIDEETYLRIYLNHLGWPLTAKETLVVTDGCIDLTEKERVRFVTGDAAAELRGIKAITGWRTKSWGQPCRCWSAAARRHWSAG